MKFFLATGVLLLLAGVFLFITGQHARNVVLVPLLLGAFWVWYGMGAAYQLSAKKQFTKSPALHEPRSVEFSDSGVKTVAGIASSQVSWKAYLRYVDLKTPFCFIPLLQFLAYIPSEFCNPNR